GVPKTSSSGSRSTAASAMSRTRPSSTTATSRQGSGTARARALLATATSSAISWPDGRPAGSRCTRFSRRRTVRRTTPTRRWAEAGAAGCGDVVFFGASGGAGAQPNPQDDPNNVWNAYFAQSTNAGRSFTVSKASDHVIHLGPLCIDGLGCNLSNPPRDRTLLDFFQVSIDPTNGAADVTFADDHAAPGTAV